GGVDDRPGGPRIPRGDADPAGARVPRARRARSARGTLMARALARRLDEGVPAADVPAPGQWAAATEPSARAYRIIAIVLLCVLGPCFLIALFAVLETGLDAVGLAIIGTGLVVLGLIGAGIPLFEKVLGARQERTAQRLRAHWTEPHRIIAAGRA